MRKILFVLIFFIFLGVFVYTKVPNFKAPKDLQVTNPTTEIVPTPESTIVAKTVPSNLPARKKVPTSESLSFEIDSDPIYDVYISSENPKDKTVTLGVYVLKTKEDIKISGSVKLFGSVIVKVAPNSKYILLSDGTYVVRGLHLISLADKKVVDINSHLNDVFFFYKDYLLYQGVNSFDNRPWGGGEAATVHAYDTVHYKDTLLYNSDLLNEYSVDDLKGDLLIVTHTYVKNSADWALDPEKTFKETIELNLKDKLKN